MARETSSAGAACIPPDDLLADDPPPLERLLAKERTAQLERLLGRLSRVQADALRLRFFGGLKFQEIADTLECSLSTAKNRVRWGLLHLAEMIDPRTAREAAGNVPLEDTTP